ncbi:MAG: ATP-binding protein [Prolixibacteraceae bacterium]
MKEVLKNSSSKWEEWLELSKQFLKSIIPNISMGVGDSEEVSLSFKIPDVQKSKEEILLLPEKIAQKKKVRFIICIDEFQNIKKFQNPSEFQEYLRAIFQYFKSTSFIIYGSKRHIMAELFDRSDMPFFKFGEMLFLNKIESVHWEKYIVERFESTGKTITVVEANRIAKLMKNHPYFVQQLCHHVWLNCEKMVDEKTIEMGLNEMLEVNEILYIREIENLTSPQIAFLRAIINKEDKLTSKEVLTNYNLGSSGNVKRLKEALANKEIIDFIGITPEFNDPSFETWLKLHYFN